MNKKRLIVLILSFVFLGLSPFIIFSYFFPDNQTFLSELNVTPDAKYETKYENFLKENVGVIQTVNDSIVFVSKNPGTYTLREEDTRYVKDIFEKSGNDINSVSDYLVKGEEDAVNVDVSKELDVDLSFMSEDSDLENVGVWRYEENPVLVEVKKLYEVGAVEERWYDSFPITLDAAFIGPPNHPLINTTQTVQIDCPPDATFFSWVSLDERSDRSYEYGFRDYVELYVALSVPNAKVKTFCTTPECTNLGNVACRVN
jgi:hypothetical protein